MLRSSQLVVAGIVAGFLGAAPFAASPAHAEDRDMGLKGVGPRVGVSFDPNQFVFGGHADLGDVFPQTALLFPVVEVGLGDNVTLVSLGTDLLFRFREQFGPWNPYAGGELAMIFADAEGGGDDTELGLSGVVGVEKGIGNSNRFAAELKFEVIDSPSVKITVGWTFGR